MQVRGVYSLLPANGEAVSVSQILVNRSERSNIFVVTRLDLLKLSYIFLEKIIKCCFRSNLSFSIVTVTIASKPSGNSVLCGNAWFDCCLMELGSPLTFSVDGYTISDNL